MPAMRLFTSALTLLAAVIVALVLGNTVLQSPPASSRLAGVSVAVTGYTIHKLGDNRDRLTLGIRVMSMRDLDECLGFTFDEPFGSRRFSDPPTGCVEPRTAATAAQVVFDGLTDDDLTFPSHTLVWGIPGGRCGMIMNALGVCVIEQAGTATMQLPWKSPFPTFGPIGSFAPIFSFEPYP